MQQYFFEEVFKLLPTENKQIVKSSCPHDNTCCDEGDKKICLDCGEFLQENLTLTLHYNSGSCMTNRKTTDPSIFTSIPDFVDRHLKLASAHLDVSLPDEHYRRVNVDATVCLLDAALHAGVRRLVHCSSVGVIGDVEHPPADEVTDCHPTNIYERTKLEGERAALDFSRQTGFPVVVMRPAWVYGPRCPRTAKLIRTISKGRFPIFGRGTNMRHPVYISDAIRGLELCAGIQGIDGEVFIIAGETPVESRELVNVIGREMRRMIRRELLAGLVIGCILAALAGPLVWWRWGDASVALAVGLAVLVAAYSTATLAAMLLPWLFSVSGRDPAFGSGPLATVIQDLLSILIYFAIAAAVVR